MKPANTNSHRPPKPANSNDSLAKTGARPVAKQTANSIPDCDLCGPTSYVGWIDGKKYTCYRQRLLCKDCPRARRLRGVGSHSASREQLARVRETFGLDASVLVYDFGEMLTCEVK